MSETDATQANAEQRAFWDEQAGPTWVALQERLDAGIRPHGELVAEVLAARPGERILDVGCGCGDTTLRLAAQVAPGGEVLGVDLSGPMLSRARERARQAGRRNVSLRQADAQTTALEAGSFDAVHSRFGVMFFDHPESAFANLRKAVRPGGRLAFVCWRAPAQNPWILVPMAAVAPLLTLPAPPPPNAPGMFALANPGQIRTVLEGAGWSEVRVVARDVAMRLGRGSLEEAVETFLEVGPVAGALREAGADEAMRAKVAAAVSNAYLEASQGGPLALGSAVWLASARNPA